MLTRSRIRWGEGEIEEFDLEIGSRIGRMASPKWEYGASSIPSEGEFLKAFMRMQTKVEELFQDRKKGEQYGPFDTKGKLEGGSEDLPKTPPSPPSFLDGSLHSQFKKQNKFDEKIDFNIPQLKLYIKFELPIYNGECNAKKLDIWIR